MSNLIGKEPNQIPTNGDLGTAAYQNSDDMNIAVGTRGFYVNGIRTSGKLAMDQGVGGRAASSHGVVGDYSYPIPVMARERFFHRLNIGSHSAMATRYVDVRTNVKSSSSMCTLSMWGNGYGQGLIFAGVSFYLYSGTSILSKSFHEFGNAANFYQVYKDSDLNLCFKVDNKTTSYGEGMAWLAFQSNETDLMTAIEVTDIIHSNSTSNQF
jgi:hypothetical protein